MKSSCHDGGFCQSFVPCFYFFSKYIVPIFNIILSLAAEVTCKCMHKHILRTGGRTGGSKILFPLDSGSGTCGRLIFGFFPPGLAASAFKNVCIKKAQHLTLLHLVASKSSRTQMLH